MLALAPTRLALPRIIGLVGRARSGKDTVAGIVQGAHPDYEIRRLAAPLKAATSALYAIPAQLFEEDAKEHVDARYGKTPRELLVNLMHFMFEQQGKEHFTRLFWATAPSDRPLIIPDVRYAHDIAAIHRRGGVVWKVQRPATGPLHTFEGHVDALPADAILVNNGTLDDLRGRVMDLLEAYRV